jgi:hypothetical protein
MTTRQSEMYKKLYEKFSSWLATLRSDNKKKDLMRACYHVWGYLTALYDYKIIDNNEYQTLVMDLKLGEGS